MRKILFFSALSIIVSCSVKKVSGPMQSDIDRVANVFPGYTLASLNEGMKLYEMNCNSCHSLKSPVSESAKGWKNIVPEMVEKANREGKNINPDQETLILRYLLTMGPLKKGS